MDERERQEQMQAKHHKNEFVSYVNNMLRMQGSIHRVDNLPDPYEPEKAASDTE